MRQYLNEIGEEIELILEEYSPKLLYIKGSLINEKSILIAIQAFGHTSARESILI